MLFRRELLKKGLRVMVGNGETISVWSRLWLLDDRFRAPLMKNILVDLNLRVCDLIDLPAKCWNR